MVGGVATVPHIAEPVSKLLVLVLVEGCVNDGTALHEDGSVLEGIMRALLRYATGQIEIISNLVRYSHITRIPGKD